MEKYISHRGTGDMNERVRLNEETLQDLINIQTGLFDPLDGFMREEDFHSAVEIGRAHV